MPNTVLHKIDEVGGRSSHIFTQPNDSLRYFHKQQLTRGKERGVCKIHLTIERTTRFLMRIFVEGRP